MNPYYLNPWRAFLGLTGAWTLAVLALILSAAVILAGGYAKMAAMRRELDALRRDCAGR